MRLWQGGRSLRDSKELLPAAPGKDKVHRGWASVVRRNGATHPRTAPRAASGRLRVIQYLGKIKVMGPVPRVGREPGGKRVVVLIIDKSGQGTSILFFSDKVRA